MSPSELRSRLQGVVGFPVTPFNADLSLDLDGLRRNLRAMLRHPPAAIVAAGGTGELYSLSPTEHLAVVRAAVEEARGARAGDRGRRLQRADRREPRTAGRPKRARAAFWPSRPTTLAAKTTGSFSTTRPSGTPPGSD